jgi:hypothetical protein
VLRVVRSISTRSGAAALTAPAKTQQASRAARVFGGLLDDTPGMKEIPA